MRDALRTILDHHGSQVASVIHLAAYYDFFGKPSSKYEEITVQGTGRLLRELRAQDFRVEQFVFSSTMLVHRPADPGQFIDENWPIEPATAVLGVALASAPTPLTSEIGRGRRRSRSHLDRTARLEWARWLGAVARGLGLVATRVNPSRG